MKALNFIVLIVFGISLLTTIGLGYAASEMDRSDVNYQTIRITFLVINGVMCLLTCAFVIFVLYTLSNFENTQQNAPL